MKIAIDCRMIGSGGIGSYLSALLPYFIKNYECTLIGTQDQLNSIDTSSSTAKKIECNIKTFSLKELFFFPKRIVKEINDCALYYTPYCNIPSGIKVPIYSTIHDVVFLDVSGLSSKIGVLIRKFFYEYAIKKSKTIFTVSEFSKQRIIHNLKTSKTIIVTYNAVPDWFFDDVSDEEKQRLPQFIFVGNIKKHKGLSILLDAFALYKDKGYNSKLLIVGNADNFRSADETVFNKVNGIKDVSFTGKISNSELKELYKTSKLLIQPSFYEGFGMPPMEALSLGCHVVMSDIPVFMEIYKDFPVSFFKTGDYKDLCDKLIEEEKKANIKTELPQIYSFNRTFDIIKNALENV